MGPLLFLAPSKYVLHSACRSSQIGTSWRSTKIYRESNTCWLLLSHNNLLQRLFLPTAISLIASALLQEFFESRLRADSFLMPIYQSVYRLGISITDRPRHRSTQVLGPSTSQTVILGQWYIDFLVQWLWRNTRLLGIASYTFSLRCLVFYFLWWEASCGQLNKRLQLWDRFQECHDW